MSSEQKVVAITGASGHLGSKLLEHLEGAPWLGKLVAFDTRPLRTPVSNIATFRNDVSQSIFAELDRHRVSSLVHLAFQWRKGLRRREADDLSERNYKMLDEVARSCVAAGVRHIIYISSHSVYGPGPDCPTPLSEDWPARPAPGYPYAEDNLRAEERLLQLSEDHPETDVTILRSCPALGAYASIDLLREQYFPGWLGLSDYNPPLQFVGDDDLARIVYLVIQQEHPGIFNVAADGVVFLREFARELAAKRVQLPAVAAHPIRRLTGGAYVANNHYLDRWPVVMSTARLRQTTGYRFHLNSLEALTALISYNEEFQECPPALREVRREKPEPRTITIR